MTGSHLTHSLYTPKYMSQLYTYNSQIQTHRKTFSATFGKFAKGYIYVARGAILNPFCGFFVAKCLHTCLWCLFKMFGSVNVTAFGELL